MSEVLRLEAISRIFLKGQPGEVRVLENTDLVLPAGEVTGLIAPSGSGKSTLLQIAGLLDTPDAGRVVLGGEDVTGARDRTRTRLRRDWVGFVYQFHNLLPEFTAAENVALPQRAAGASRAEAMARAAELLEAVGLGPRADHRPGELSGGEQQRVAICRALANRPRLLLADEPTGNLDPETSERVFAVLLELVRNTGMSALIATHNLELAARMDRVLRLSGGKVVAA